jgi:hypothetical protein
MTALFDRRCSVTLSTLQLEGFRVKFNIQKTLKPEPNKALIEVYNLSETHRGQLGQLAPGKKAKTGKAGRGKASPPLLGTVPVRLEAGYADPGPEMIFLGNLRTVDSERMGPDWVTSIASGDGERAFRTARINQSFGPRTPPDVALRALVKSLGLGNGNMAQVLSSLRMNGSGTLLTRGLVLSGPTARMMSDFCRSANLEWSIQDGNLQFVDLNTALSQKAVVLSPSTGMIESPNVDGSGVLQCKTLMIPGLRCGALVVVKGVNVQGTYRVEKITYEGDTHGHEWGCVLEGRRY